MLFRSGAGVVGLEESIEPLVVVAVTAADEGASGGPGWVDI